MEDKIYEAVKKSEADYRKLQGSVKENDWRGQMGNREIKKTSFFRLSKKRFLTDWHDLNPIQREIMTDLWLYAGNKTYSWPGQPTLAKDLNVSVSTIKRNLKILAKKQFFKIELAKSSRGKYNIYHLLR